MEFACWPSMLKALVLADLALWHLSQAQELVEHLSLVWKEFALVSDPHCLSVPRMVLVLALVQRLSLVL
jgi:hypothetical protein